MSDKVLGEVNKSMCIITRTSPLCPYSFDLTMSILYNTSMDYLCCLV